MERRLEKALCQRIEECKKAMAAEKENRHQLILNWVSEQLIRFPDAELLLILNHLDIYMMYKFIEPIEKPLAKVYSNVELSTIIYSAINQYDNTSRKDCAKIVKSLFMVQFKDSSVDSINKKMNVIRCIPGVTNKAAGYC